MPDAEAEHLQQILKDRGISTDMQRLPQEAYKPMLDTFRKADATRRHKGPEAALRLIRVELRNITAEAMAEERLIDARIEEAEEARRMQSVYAEETDRRLLGQISAIMSLNQGHSKTESEARACRGPDLTEATPLNCAETLIQEI